MNDIIAQDKSREASSASGTNSEQLGLGQALEEIPEEDSAGHSGSSSGDGIVSAASFTMAPGGGESSTRLPQARPVKSGRDLLSRGKVIMACSVPPYVACRVTGPLVARVHLGYSMTYRYHIPGMIHTHQGTRTRKLWFLPGT